MAIKPSSTKYEFSLAEIQRMFAEQLEVPADRIVVIYKIQAGSPDDRFYSGPVTHTHVTSVEVIVR